MWNIVNEIFTNIVVVSIIYAFREYYNLQKYYMLENKYFINVSENFIFAISDTD